MRPVVVVAALLFALPAAAQEAATLVLTTTPPGAAVTLDGKLLGLAPRTETVAAGVHTVTAELGGEVTTVTVELAAGETRRLEVALGPKTPARRFPTAGAITFAGGALALTAGLLLRFPAEDAAREVSALFERGGGWDAGAQRLEDAGLAAQTWSAFFTLTGAALLASGALVAVLELALPGAPLVSAAPLDGGGLVAWSLRW